MAYKTDYDIRDATIEGFRRDWTIHRYKAALSGGAGPYPQMGTATDVGFDVPITGVSVLLEGTAGVCGFPTQKDWSILAGAMEFCCVFTSTGAVSADLEVDVSFYQCSWGDSGQPERWEFLFEYSFRDGESPIKLVTDGKQIFGHITDISNPDPNVEMQLLCRMADAEGGAGGSSGEGPATNWEGVEAIGNLTYDNTQRKWVPWRGTEADGAQVDEKNSDDILTAITALGTTSTDLFEAHLLQMMGQPGIYSSPNDFTAAYTAADQITLTLGSAPIPTMEQFIGVYEKLNNGVLIPWLATEYRFSYAGGLLVVLGASFAATSDFVVLYADRTKAIQYHDIGVTNANVMITGGEALDDPTAAAVADGDAVRQRYTLTGGALAAGMDVANTQSRNLPVEIGDGASQDVGLPVGGICTNAVPPAAVDTNIDFACLTMDMNRQLWTTSAAGIALLTCIDTHDLAPTDAHGLKILIEALDNPPGAAVANTDLTRPRGTTSGYLGVAGYDLVNTQSRDLPLSTIDDAVGTYGLPIVGRVDTTVPAAADDGDAQMIYMTPEGGQVMAGVDVVNTIGRNLPVENTDDATQDVGVPVGAKATALLPAAIDNGDYGTLTTDLNRQLRVTAGGGALIAAMGLPGNFFSPVDFNAAYAAATQLTLTGLDPVPDSVQFVGIVEQLTGGSIITWLPSDHAFALAAGVLTVTGATFTNTSAFAVIYADQQKAYDATLDALQIVQMNAYQRDITSRNEVETAHDLAAAAPADSGWINVAAMMDARLAVEWLTGAGAGVHSLSIQAYGNDTDAGTDEYIMGPDPYVLGYEYNGAATTVKFTRSLDVRGLTRIKFDIDEAGGTGKGTITVGVRSIN